MTQRESWFTRITAVKNEGRIPIIAEIKPSSPAAGELLGNRSITEITSAYVTGGAACISVVTGRWFGGNISMLSKVAQATSLPLLRKDLIVNSDQIKQSQEHGANAILLTTKILRKTHLMKMIELCHSLDITPFVEVSDIDELNDITLTCDTIIGITNRDIAQKEMDVNSGLNSLNLINKLNQKPGAIVSASGINNPEEASTLYHAGFDGLLIGTALLKAKHPEDAVREFSLKGKRRGILANNKL